MFDCYSPEQLGHAFGPVNIFSYNRSHPDSMIEPCDPSCLTGEQKEELLLWYVSNGGESGLISHEVQLVGMS